MFAFVGAKVVLWVAAAAFGYAGWVANDVAHNGAKVGPVDIAPIASK